MHELSLCQSIVRLADQCAQRAGTSQILRITLELGAGAAIETETLYFCFGIVSEGTLAEGAELAIDWVPMKLRCRSCNQIYHPKDPARPEACPDCGHFDTECLEGRELNVKHIEVED